jgi:hypothetical protein
MQKAWPGAQKMSERALSHLSTNATAHYMRGLTHEEQDELGKARLCVLRAVALDPDFKQPYLALAGCELRLEAFGQALYNRVFVRHGRGEQGTGMDEISQQAAVALPRVFYCDRRLSLFPVLTGPVTFVNPEASDDLLTWEV